MPQNAVLFPPQGTKRLFNRPYQVIPPQGLKDGGAAPATPTDLEVRVGGVATLLQVRVATVSTQLEVRV